jgi:DNA-binding GntR family transcriptional regulator
MRQSEKNLVMQETPGATEKLEKEPRVAGRQAGSAPSGRNSRLDQHLYEQLRHDIVTLVLRPGQRVSEQLVSVRYGAAKAAVRRALLRLVQDELVQSRARSGHYISPVTLRDMQELYAVRRILLPQAAAMAAASDCQGLEMQFQRLIETDFTPNNPDSVLQYCLENRNFLVAIGEASKNRILAGLIADIEDRAIRILFLNSFALPRLNVLRTQIGEIYDSIRSGDPERARALVLFALEDSEAAANEAVLRLPHLQSVNLGAQSEPLPSKSLAD